MSRLSRLRKVTDPRYWPQAAWRVRALRDRSGRIESLAAAEVDRYCLHPREPHSLYSRDGQRPLRILVVAMKHDYGSFNRGLSYEQNHFTSTLAESGYDVVHFDFLGLARKHGRSTMNLLLRECATRTLPDLAFFVLFGDEIEPSTVDYLRAQGIGTFNWFCDDQWRYESFSSRWAPHFDYVATTSAAMMDCYARDGHLNVIKTQWGVNASLFERTRISKTAKDIDVVFVGQPHGNRRDMVKLLREGGIDVRAYGYGWPDGRVSYGEMIDLFARSRIVLGLSNDWSGQNPQIKGRDFEVPASGSLHLTASHPELGDYFEIDKEIVCYSNERELTELCNFYLEDDDERERIAEAGQERVFRDHAYTERFREIFETLGYRSISARGRA